MTIPVLLRKQLRAQRRALSPDEHQQSSRRVVSCVITLDCFTNAQHIAGYFAHDGEPDLSALFEQAFALGKRVYLPVLNDEPRGPLLFAPYHTDTPLTPNRFGIPEPRVAREDGLAAQALDLVLTPLVAFAVDGTRLGMGGGYYDRTFAFRCDPAYPPKPHLLGLAFELQKVPDLPRQPWDVPLDEIVTEAAVYVMEKKRF
jgi:5-formyltetrahydrofolate cyclo-ligase